MHMTVEYISSLDTRRFGFNIGRIDDPGILCSPGFPHELRVRNIQLVISRVAAEDVQTLNVLEDMGFRVMDIQITWRLSMEHPTDHRSRNTGIMIREGKPTDKMDLRRIAESAFDNYGHYFADQHLDKSRCREIYPDWAERTLIATAAADKVFVAEAEGRVVGFLSFRVFQKDSARYAASAMGAVEEQFRGRNIFSALVLAGIGWGQENHLAWEEHNVLAINYPVNRVFSKLGFSPVSSWVTLHYWPDR